MDDHGHGTHVAGTIAAAFNNLDRYPAAEKASPASAPHALILPTKCASPMATCNDFAIAQAIDGDGTDGAKVINMSLGSY